MRDMVKRLRAALPDAIRTARKRTRRSIVRLWLDITHADQDTRFRAEKAFRGREQLRLLRQSDAVVLSAPKSGRTWLRVMISRLYQQIYGLPDGVVLEFDNFHSMNRKIPKLFFSHDEHIREFTGHLDSKVDYYDKKVLLMVRDPRDVVVSSFFHIRHRTKAWKGLQTLQAPHETSGNLFDFVLHEQRGLSAKIDFMNGWIAELPNVRAHEMVRYEDMRENPHQTLTRVAEFLNIPASDEQIEESIKYSSYESMKQKEFEQSFKSSGSRLKPGDKDNPDSYKVRRGKVGGYRDYFEDDQLAVIDAMVADKLDPRYGYTGVDHADATSV